MKNNIIVTTDFSESSANALNYACGYANAHNFNILLVHIYTIPVSYAAEGLSLAAIETDLEEDKAKLRAELERAKSSYPGVIIEAKMATGDYLECLKEVRREADAGLMIMGTNGEYSELWFWDENWLDALIALSCPVLVIPRQITYSNLKNIAFACDYKKVCEPHQSEAIKDIVKLTGASFHIVHVSQSPAKQTNIDKADAIKAGFSDLSPQYHTVENSNIIRGLAGFIKQYNIDLLLVIPRRHSVWDKLMNKSHTKQLALLNHIPVMAIHEND